MKTIIALILSLTLSGCITERASIFTEADSRYTISPSQTVGISFIRKSPSIKDRNFYNHLKLSLTDLGFSVVDARDSELIIYYDIRDEYTDGYYFTVLCLRLFSKEQAGNRTPINIWDGIITVDTQEFEKYQRESASTLLEYLGKQSKLLTPLTKSRKK